MALDETMRSQILFTFLLLHSLFGCGADTRSAASNPESKLDSQVAQMKSQLDEIQKSVLRLQFEVNSEKTRYESAVFDASSKGYQRVDTSTGTFLISLEDIKPYGNGYQLLLSIGNPSAATYSGFSIIAKWGKSFSDVSDFAKWEDQKREQSFSYTEKLLPSSWNKVRLVLAPAQKEDLGYIEVTLRTDVIFLTIR